VTAPAVHEAKCCTQSTAARQSLFIWWHRFWLTLLPRAQIFYAGDVATSSIKYNSDELADSGTSLFHELGELETRGRWCRIWCAARLPGVTLWRICRWWSGRGARGSGGARSQPCCDTCAQRAQLLCLLHTLPSIRGRVSRDRRMWQVVSICAMLM